MAAAELSTSEGEAGFDPERAKLDFPILQRSGSDKALVFLDSAASAQKPNQVIDAISDCYREEYANIHRGVYDLSARSTAMFERVRETAQRFLGAAESREIVWFCALVPWLPPERSLTAGSVTVTIGKV